ncbi:MAG: DEAD/DEAH box helicase [Leptospiraceae bacterium]|nr:DEAD/DEAH box helicase [Leptospiraceae bacterium]MCP5511764.1 DEAD/DEAH box helicase [Leptospiraceae bacterium]
MNFNELEIHDDLKKAFEEIGFSTLTPIQEKAIPYALEGKDVTGLAQTGTGKTISFLVPIIHKMLTENPEGPVALILAPTRELVMQICDEAKRLLKFTDKKVATIIGGTGYKEQEKELSDKSDIVVATPGRLIDHIKSGKLDLSNIKFFILDEADRMFDMGFIKDIRYVMKKCPQEKQVMLFSATLSYYVIRLANDYLNDPVEVEIERDSIVTDNIEQNVIHLGRDEKLPYLTNLILNDKEEGLGIIFTNLKVLVPDIVNSLRRYGIAITGISSMLDQKKRIRLLKDFKLGKYQYMVATDVASRGIDVENIKVVYNYDLPGDIENYVHRIGRTARAGKKGKSLSFCSERDYVELDKIEKYIGNKLDVLQVDEKYLKFPEGNFEKFIPHGEKENFESGRPQNNKKKKGPNDRKKFPEKKSTYGEKSSERTNSRPNHKKKPRPERDKNPEHPLDMAKGLIEKADSVLVTENKNKKPGRERPPRKKEVRKENFKPREEVITEEDSVKPYDKSRRNLFDINDVKKDDKGKKSVWSKIKSLFGF